MTLFPQDIQRPSGSHYTCAFRRVLWKHMTPFLTMQSGLFTFASSSWSQIHSAGAESLCYRHVHTLSRKTLFHISCAALHSNSHVHVRREHWEPFYDFFPHLVTLLLRIRHNKCQPSSFRFFAHRCLDTELLPLPCANKCIHFLPNRPLTPTPMSPLSFRPCLIHLQLLEFPPLW